MRKMKMTKNSYYINGKRFKADNCIGGVLINPVLPKDFDGTSNDARPVSHQKFWGLPYIETYSDADFDPASHTDEYADKRRAHWAANSAEREQGFCSNVNA